MPGASPVLDVVKSEPELAVRWLAAALALWKRSFFGSQVNWRARQYLMDITAHDAAAIGPVPIALNNHRSAAFRA